MAAKTYFCYGIPVTNESLTYATMAYPKLDGPFRFIRLVQERLRNGTLRTAQPSAVGSTPIEIWDLVQHEITDVELSAAECKFLKRHACKHCRKPHGCRCGCGPAVEWGDLLFCDACTEHLLSYEGFGKPTFAKKCRILLHNYGLDLPSTQMLKWSNSESCDMTDGDPNSVAFIAFSRTSDPDKIDADDHASCEQPEVDEGDFYRNDGIWSISFTKPANADLRFRRLLRDLHLTPLRVSDGTVGIGKTPSARRERTYKRIRPDEVRPQWRLFTTVVCDW